jgi:hypothetical protein
MEVRSRGSILLCNSDESWHGVAWKTGLLEARVEVFHKQVLGDVDCEGCGSCLAIIACFELASEILERGSGRG